MLEASELVFRISDNLFLSFVSQKLQYLGIVWTVIFDCQVTLSCSQKEVAASAECCWR